MSLAVHYIRFFACRSRLRNSGANCSTVGLCCVTIAWQQIFEDALQVTVEGVLLSVAISDVLTSDLLFSDKFLLSDVSVTNLMLTRLLFLFSIFYSLTLFL